MLFTMADWVAEPALFMARLELALERTRTGGDYLFAVLFLDLDRFKVVNDSLDIWWGTTDRDFS